MQLLSRLPIYQEKYPKLLIQDLRLCNLDFLSKMYGQKQFHHYDAFFLALQYFEYAQHKLDFLYLSKDKRKSSKVFC